MEIIISAVDSASEVFQSIISSATSMADGISGAIEGASSDFDAISENVAGFSDAVANIDDGSLEQLADQLGMDTEEVERLIAAGADMGTLSAGFNEASSAADELEQEIQDDIDKMEELGSAGDVMAAQTFMDMANSMKDSMLGMADSAGTFNDSMMRASLEAEGAGISVDEMKTAVSNLSEETGRAGGSIRESFITAVSRGITDMDSFNSMMTGAGAQATLLGTDIQSVAQKYSDLAARSSISEMRLKGTGITMQELGEAMGMTGATADEVSDKWKTLDANQRAAALGMAASLNEGKDANDAYKTSWAGLQEQMEIAKGRLERIVGSVILPVLIPAMKLAGDILNGVGDVISGIMAGPLGGLVSIIGTLGGAFVIAVTGAAALRNFIAFLKIETLLETAATWLNTAAKIANAEGSTAAGLANAILSGGFMTSAAAAWSAAAAFLAATWPLWVIIGVAALVVAAVYEIGKAFGWWTDVSSMIDAVKDGIGRLWSAFINHPDVQAAISMISNALSTLWSWIVQAGQAVLEFFGINSEGNFNIVRALIDSIGFAWSVVTAPIRLVISAVQALSGGFQGLQGTVGSVWNAIMNIVGPIVTQIMGFINSLIGTINRFRTGQIDLPTFILTILTQLWNVYVQITLKISQLMIKWGRQLLTYAIRAGRNVLNGVISFVRQLPGRAYSFLLQVVNRIVSAGARWVSSAKEKAKAVVDGAANTLSSLPDRIASALSGVVDAIVKPFEDAYNTAKGWWDQIVSMASNTPSVSGAAGGDHAAGGDIIPASGMIISEDNSKLEVDHNLNVTLDLSNVPSHIDTGMLIGALTDRKVLRALTESSDFQLLDGQAKEKLNLRVNRSRGV